ncbi:hypothetical protein [Pleionea sediminis]|uniref:hypothetical protein n=1 Tax=Pleionea sediminis TaxID=2569479 RepID=UPI001185CABD|nr:hypothetical protein [Pleionea sediminis]
MKISFKFLSSLLILVVFNSLFLVSDAKAGLCTEAGPEVGNWVNNDANTRGVTRVEITSRCVDDSIRQCNGDICSVIHNVKRVYDVRVWGSCSPTDCYWGKVEGLKTSADWLRFFYNQSHAYKWVWAQIWSGSDNWLRVVVERKYKDDREDSNSWYWFRRQ